MLLGDQDGDGLVTQGELNAVVEEIQGEIGDVSDTLGDLVSGSGAKED